ncbi:uncharacterized protein [Coffea arabica]|uniref:RNase H type-1 domain-containing protein n=1 Tax=Coffea arabica TaxID=13443 RepID=A0ABM4UKM5_COFAR
MVTLWLPSPEGAVKLNTDASMTREKISGGGLLLDHEGKLIFAFYKEFGDVNVLTTKSLALLHGLLFCDRGWVQRLLVEVDSAGLVQLLDSGALAKWPLCNSLWRIRGLLQSFNATAKHIFREANTAAYKLATMGSQDDFFSTSLQYLPREIMVTLLLDSRGVPVVRTQCRRE